MKQIGVTMKIHGSCHCGQVTYIAEVDPERVNICHCSDCETLTGSAYRVSVPTLVKDFVLETGAPKEYIKVAESGVERAQVFCSNCGSPLYTYAVGQPTIYGLRTGCIAERNQLFPSRQIWCESALDWSMNIEALPARGRE
jgi:hypothetical protein